MFRPLVAALAMAATPAAAQELWLGADASIPVTTRVEIGLDTIARIGEDGLYETEMGAMLSYDLGGVKIAAGYVRVAGYDRGTLLDLEDRTRQQVSSSFGPFSARLRFEQRFLNTGGDMGLRMRPQVALGVPLTGTDAEVVLSHESFIELNDTDWGQDAGLRRTRHFVGIEARLLRALSFEAGYIHQFNRGRRGGADSAEHVASLGLSFGF